MELSEILIIIVLFLNLIAILFVAYQTYLSRNSLLLTIKNLNQDRKKHDVELLPKAHFIFKAQFHLNRWLKSVTDINTELKKAIKIQDADTLKNLPAKRLKAQRGLWMGFPLKKAPTGWWNFFWPGLSIIFYTMPR